MAAERATGGTVREPGPGPARIALVGDRDESVTAHRAIPRALALARAPAPGGAVWEWVETTTLAGLVAERLAGYSGFWCVPASPYRSTEGALAAIRFARETGRAFLGTCGGFQHALLEYARNELGLEEAGHPEIDPDTPLPLLAPLACELVEQSAKVRFTPGSLLRRIYGTVEAKEIYHCRYGLNPAHVSLLLDGRMRIAATDAAGEVRAVELRSHPFFLATAYQPERAALRGSSHPVVEAFVRASTRALQVE